MKGCAEGAVSALFMMAAMGAFLGAMGEANFFAAEEATAEAEGARGFAVPTKAGYLNPQRMVPPWGDSGTVVAQVVAQLARGEHRGTEANSTA